MKPMKIVAAAAALAISTIAAQADTLRVGLDGGYPPFSSQNANGEMEGFDVDIAKAICVELKKDCEIVVQAWDGLIPGLIEGKYDVIVNSMSITEERLKSVDFTEKYYSNYISVVAKKDKGVTIDGLKSMTVGSQRATISADWAEKELGARADIKLYDTQTAAYADLLAGRVDALVADYLPITDWIKTNTDYGFVGGPININDEIGVAVAKNNEALRDSVSAAIKALRMNGVYQTINAKYFDVDIY